MSNVVSFDKPKEPYTFSAEFVDSIITGLGEVPAKYSMRLIGMIQQECHDQRQSSKSEEQPVPKKG